MPAKWPVVTNYDVSVVDFLDFSLPIEYPKSVLQKKTLAKAILDSKQRIFDFNAAENLEPSENELWVMIVDVSRREGCTYGEVCRMDHLCPTIKCGDSGLWAVVHNSKKIILSHAMTTAERASLQGVLF